MLETSNLSVPQGAEYAVMSRGCHAEKSRRPSTAPMPGQGRASLAASGKEGVPKHLVGDASALRDALRLVERPIDAEVDPALAVFLFGLGQRREAARKEWPYDTLIVFGLAVELVRHERERDAIGPVSC